MMLPVGGEKKFDDDSDGGWHSWLVLPVLVVDVEGETDDGNGGGVGS